MNAITSILARLPKAKTSADFDAALADLETEHAAALAAVGTLESQREDMIFTGGNLGKLERDIAEAEGRVKTLGVAIEGATKRQAAAVEAERQAALEATAKVARQHNAKLRTRLIAFASVAEELAGHASEIKQLRAEILTANSVVREAGRRDLAVDDPIRSLPEIVGRQVHDPVKALVIPEFWPRHPDGPALLKLTK